MKKPNSYWNNDISQEEIYNREFSIGYLLQTNTHIPLIADLKDKVLAIYHVRALFTFLGYNGHQIYCNGQKLVYSNSKFAKSISLGDKVTMIDHNLTVCGSNKYPGIANKKGQYCIIEFTSFGLPYVDRVNGWSIELLTINTI